MSERLFMLELKMELRGLPDQTKEELLAEYETYFQEAKNEGFTEEEIITRLGGSAKVLAQSIREQIDREEEPIGTGRNVIVVIGLILFNLIIVLGPFLAVSGAGIALLVTFGMCLISPLLVLIQFIFQGGHLFDLMISFILFGSMLLIYPYVQKGIAYYSTLVRAYIQWNKRLMRGGVA